MQHGHCFVGNVFLQTQHPQGRAALTRRVKCRHQDIRHHLLRQCRAVHDQGILPACFSNQGDFSAFFLRTRRQIAVNDLRHFGGASENHTFHTWVIDQGGTHHLAAPWQKLQHMAWHTRFMQQLHRTVCDQWCLLGWFRQNTVARRQRCGDFTDKNRQREIPRRNAHHRTQSLALCIGLHLRAVIT